MLRHVRSTNSGKQGIRERLVPGASVPEVGMVALTWLLGSYALVFGVLLIWLGVHLRHLYQTAAP